MRSEKVAVADALWSALGGEAGAWIRFHPRDGKGCKDANVIAYRCALIESDTLPTQRQCAILRQLHD